MGPPHNLGPPHDAPGQLHALPNAGRKLQVLNES